MNWQEVELKVQKLNNGLLGLMDNISSMTKKDSRYPKTSEAFDSAYSHLKNPAYDIVVCGEVKKGKSSLLNAIIGQEVLPVDVDIATSQVFRISNSVRESFSLVFTDGTSQPITRDQLTNYGSQVNVDRNGCINLGDRLLSHIQINVSAQFLPENVNLVDTPGLGSVYKSHEWITQNYVKKAAAVLFVFDVTQPMIEIEKTFIKKVLDITPNVMYVMTKIDTVSSVEWTAQLKRIEAGLTEIYTLRNLPVPIVYPISSKALMDAATEEDMSFRNENFTASYFPAVKEALLNMILRAVAMSYPTMALYESQGHIIKTKTLITDLLNAAADEGKELDRELKDRKIAKQRELQEEWGRDSKQTQSVSAEISNVCNIVYNRVDQMFRLTSPIREQYISSIDAVTTMDEVEELCKSLPSSVANDIAQQWDSIMHDATNEVETILHSAISDIDRYILRDTSQSEINVLELTTSQKLNTVRTILGTGLLATTLATLVFPPIAPIAAGITALIAWFAGKNDEVLRNKNNMKAELNKILDKISHNLKDAQSYKHPSIVGEFVGNLKTRAETILQEYVDTKKREMEDQLRSLEEQARKDIDQKRQECDYLQAEISEWSRLVQTTNGLVTLRESIEQQIS